MGFKQKILAVILGTLLILLILLGVYWAVRRLSVWWICIPFPGSAPENPSPPARFFGAGGDFYVSRFSLRYWEGGIPMIFVKTREK